MLFPRGRGLTELGTYEGTIIELRTRGSTEGGGGDNRVFLQRFWKGISRFSRRKEKKKIYRNFTCREGEVLRI